MSTQVEFTDREKEMEVLQRALHAWDSREAVFVQGGGGVGKTRLLKEAYQRLADSLHPLQSPHYKERPLTLGVLAPMCQNHWGQTFMAGCREMAQDLGVQIVFGRDDTNYDDAMMLDEFDRMVQRHPNAIIVDLAGGPELAERAANALLNGIQIVSVTGDLPVNGVVWVEQAEKELALRSLQPLIRDIDGEGEVAVCWAPGYQPADIRWQALAEMLHQYPRVQMLGPVGENLTSSHGLEALLEEHPQIKAVWADTAPMAIDAYRILKEHNRSDIPLYSIDIDETVRACMLEADSAWRVAVGSDPAEIGHIAVRIAVRLAYGDRVMPRYIVPHSRVTQSYLRTLPPGQPLSAQNIPGWGSKIAWTDWLFQLHARHLPPGTRAEHIDLSHYRQDVPRRHSYLLLGLLDLDNAALQTAQDVAIAIINCLEGEDFSLYLDQLAQLSRLVDRIDLYESKRQLVDEIFIECLSRAAGEHRIILFCDTTEAARDTLAREAAIYLMRLAAELRNVAVVASGRDAIQLFQETNAPSLHKSLIELQPFAETVCKSYLQRKGELLNVPRLSAELEAKVLFLSGGMPIVMDLAMESLARRVALDWMTDESLEALQALPEAELDRRRQDFERHLVEDMSQLRTERDRLIANLAWIHPMDAELCACVLHIDREKATALIDDVRGSVFIKTLPNNEIKLHDRMQEIVSAHILPHIEEERKLYYFSGALRYYELRMEQYQKHALSPDSPLTVLKQENLLRAYWQAGQQYLRYARDFSDPTITLKAFCNLFDVATQRYNYVIRDSYVDLIASLLTHLPGEWLYPVLSRVARHNSYLGRYEAVQEMTQILLDTARLKPGERLDVLTLQAAASLNMGQASEAVEGLKLALAVCQKTPSLRQWKAQVMTTLGYAQRVAGNPIIARDLYERALKSNPREQQVAPLYNNLGFMYCIQGDYEAALDYCRRAMQLSRELQDTRMLGITYQTLGEVFRWMGEYPDALEHYRQAIAIFEPQNDTTWLARTYSRRGATYRLMGQYEQARSDLRRSIQYNFTLEMPWIHHVLGCVYFDESQQKGQAAGAIIDRERMDKALAEFQVSQSYATEVKDWYNLANNWLVSAQAYRLLWLASGKDDPAYLVHIQNIADKFAQLAEEEHEHQRGRLQQLQGHVAFEQGDYQKALEWYAESYPNLASRQAGYGHSNFDLECALLEERLCALAEINPDLTRQWLETFHRRWDRVKIAKANRDKLLRKLFLAEGELRRKYKL